MAFQNADYDHVPGSDLIHQPLPTVHNLAQVLPTKLGNYPARMRELGDALNAIDQPAFPSFGGLGVVRGDVDRDF
jgi:hypothetical protein